jgi:hypothetical protein
MQWHYVDYCGIFCRPVTYSNIHQDETEVSSSDTEWGAYFCPAYSPWRYQLTKFSRFTHVVGFVNHSYHLHHHHHQILLLLVEQRASMKSFQALWSPAIPLTLFHDLPMLCLLFHLLLFFAMSSSVYLFFYIPVEQLSYVDVNAALCFLSPVMCGTGHLSFMW